MMRVSRMPTAIAADAIEDPPRDAPLARRQDPARSIGEIDEIALAARGEGADRLDESDRSLLHQVGHRQALFFSGRGQADDQAKIHRHQPLQAGPVAELRSLQQPLLLAVAERPCGRYLPQQVAHGLGVAVAYRRARRRIVLFAAYPHAFDFTTRLQRLPGRPPPRWMFHVLHRHPTSRIAILGTCALGRR